MKSFINSRFFVTALVVIIPYLTFTSIDSTGAKTRPGSNSSDDLKLQKIIRGNIAPKSVVHSGKGLFFAQNMMYRHTITVYNREYKLVKTIPDRIKLSKYGYSRKGSFKGSPVEAAFSPDGSFVWVSNYQMYGKGFHNPGHDSGGTKKTYDKSFLYGISTTDLKIKRVVKVGSVPKYLAVTPDNKYVIVSNWSSGDISIVSTEHGRIVKTVDVGRYPRGIAIDPNSRFAYITIMGGKSLAKIDLKDFSKKIIWNIGRSPRHLCISPDNKYLYLTLNGEGLVVKIDLTSNKIIRRLWTGHAPRSMAITGDGKYLYVVNYKSNTVSKVRTGDMKLICSAKTESKPIGITFDDKEQKIWVACYSGAIMVYKDRNY